MDLKRQRYQLHRAWLDDALAVARLNGEGPLGTLVFDHGIPLADQPNASLVATDPVIISVCTYDLWGFASDDRWRRRFSARLAADAEITPTSELANRICLGEYSDV